MYPLTQAEERRCGTAPVVADRRRLQRPLRVCFLIDGLARVEEDLRRGLEGLSAEQLVFRPAEHANSIAWLAHRLASLHDEEDKKIFDSVTRHASERSRARIAPWKSRRRPPRSIQSGSPASSNG